MAKKKHYRRKSNSKVNIRNIALSNEDVIRDYSHLSKLRVNDSTRDWIETRMYELREEANVYEMNCISYFQNKGEEFIHQAPFVIDGKIYFADFYLPKRKIIIEIDGKYHDSNSQHKYDKIRDSAFASYGIRTFRVPNEMAKSQKLIKIALSEIWQTV